MLSRGMVALLEESSSESSLTGKFPLSCIEVGTLLLHFIAAVPAYLCAWLWTVVYSFRSFKRTLSFGNQLEMPSRTRFHSRFSKKYAESVL